ncbi:GNAT family N-acetyltransferase [Kitasatospora sp. NPDC059648]|uniref:GNAT family N-acetyltransferase n=1 Tax=Kitasatospora sp. NPDC059648 TaxID=3346894 RepID=UPI0036B3009A
MTTGSTATDRPARTAQAPAAPAPAPGSAPVRVPAPSAEALADAPMRQARNSAAFWSATGRSRGHEVIRRRGFVAVDGDERAGLRILIQEPDLGPDELAELSGLARRAVGPVNAEDPYSATDLGHLGMRSLQMPVMLRPPAPVGEPALEVIRARRPEDLQQAERIVIAGFELAAFEPHRPGELFPAALVDQPGASVFLARHEGVAAGACVRLVHEGFVSHYWVGTCPDLRSRGAGRAVMLASLADVAALPATLTASRLGRPLYESLGYTAAAPATWWALPRPAGLA